MPRTDDPLLRRAMRVFANATCCADDHAVAEMLSVLDEDVLESIAEAFSKRIMSQGHNNAESWIAFCGIPAR